MGRSERDLGALGSYTTHWDSTGRRPGAGWEIYVDDPQEVAADALRTEIYLPIE